jgi:hypothetical protein
MSAANPNAVMQRYALELYNALRLSGNGTRTRSIGELGRVALSEAARIADLAADARMSAVPGPVRAASGAPGSPSRAARIGLGVLEQQWPPARKDVLHELLEDIASVERVWDAARTGGGEVRRALDAIADRRDHAVRLVSARFYEAARSVGLGEPAIDAVAADLARHLGSRLCGDPDLVFAARCGGFDQSVHELIGPGSASGTIRGIAFGTRSDDRTMRSKALVEAAEGGAP